MTSDRLLGSTSTQLQRTIDRLLGEGQITASSDGSVRELNPIAISRAEGEALRNRVLGERASKTIEIGLGYAISTLFMCDGLAAGDRTGASHVAMDPFQSSSFADCGLQVLEEAGVADLLEFHTEESQVVLPRLLREGRAFDLAFVDGNHRFDRVFVDLAFLGRLVRPGGVIFLDDYQLPGIARAASFYTKNMAWTLEEVSPTDNLHQWAVLRTSAEPDTRPFDHFVDF